jgi:hypothetical protein
LEYGDDKGLLKKRRLELQIEPRKVKGQNSKEFKAQASDIMDQLVRYLEQK